MKTKICLLLMILFTGICTYAQEPASADIKKYKIKKVIRQDQNDNTSTEWRYNANGHDTAMYTSGIRNNYKKTVYDTKQRIKTITQYADDGKQTETTIYTYKPDGSFTTKNTDAQYGMINLGIYDAKGLKKTHTVPDGSVHHYAYNTRGQLVKSYSVPKNGGVKFTNTYTYDAKGKMLSRKSAGEYPSTSSFEYNSKGLLSKTTITSGADGEEKTITVYVYTYEY